jgi:hypothetical protein
MKALFNSHIGRAQQAGLGILWLSSCAGSPENKASNDSNTAEDSGGVANAPTYHGDIVPMMQSHCTRCHRPNGQGPGDFTDVEMVEVMAEVMAAQMEAGNMPPPVADPSCRDFIGSEHLSLGAEDLAIFQAWIQGGKLRGEEPAEAVLPPVEPELSEPDLELLIPAAYAPTFTDTANPANEYRCFVLDHGMEGDFFITALHPLVDQADLLHHAVLYTLPEEELEPGWDSPEGFNCIDGMGNMDAMLSGWAPGALPLEMPEGSGIRVRSGSRLVLQLHYYLPSPEMLGQADRSGYAFRTAESVSKEIYYLPFGAYSFRIPAGESNHTHRESLSFPEGYPSVSLWGVFPHMHKLGRGYRMWIEEEDGSETCLLEGTDRYDFNNQLTYMWREPAGLAPGISVHFECDWDNSAENPNQTHVPPEDVGYGERTDEEMCFAFTMVSVGAP